MLFPLAKYNSNFLILSISKEKRLCKKLQNKECDTFVEQTVDNVSDISMKQKTYGKSIVLELKGLHLSNRNMVFKIPLTHPYFFIA